jgi:hypothetical protein
MTKGLLKFFTYFTSIDRIKHCVKGRTRGALLHRLNPDNTNDFIVVGRLYVSEHNAYIVLSPWHIKGFNKLIKPYVHCTKLLTYQRRGTDDAFNIIYHITGIKSIDYVYDFK